MMQRPNPIRRAALALAALVAVSCQQFPTPHSEHAVTDFVVDDPELADELRAAADEWANAGLEVADYVTVNQTASGVPVRARARPELLLNCNIRPENRSKRNPSGCAELHGGQFVGLLKRRIRL